MLYKTILLELLELRPQFHEELRKNRQILPWLDEHSLFLKGRQDEWMRVFSRKNPGTSPDQFRREAMEMALADMIATLPPESPLEETGDFPIEEAIRSILRPSPGA